jgi:hypothetical protein
MGTFQPRPRNQFGAGERCTQRYFEAFTPDQAYSFRTIALALLDAVAHQWRICRSVIGREYRAEHDRAREWVAAGCPRVHQPAMAPIPIRLDTYQPARKTTFSAPVSLAYDTDRLRHRQ